MGSSSQSNHNKVCIVVPCYNESENIPKIIDQIEKMRSNNELIDFDFVFVDDGSKDNSYDLLVDASNKYSWVKMQNHPVNMGFAAGLSTGRKYALNNSYGYIGQIDCDLTHPLNLLKVMYDCFPEYDMVIASRYVGDGGMKNVPLWRVLISKFSQFGFKLLFGLKTKDATSGFRLCKSVVFEQIPLKENTFAIQLELTVKSERMGLKIKEIPFVLVNREFGISKFSLKQYVTYAKSVYRIYFMR